MKLPGGSHCLESLDGRGDSLGFETSVILQVKGM